MKQGHKIGLMLFFFAICATAAFVSHDVQRPPPPARPADLYSVVDSQFQAFRAEDFPRAYQQAAAGIRERFSMEQFEQMVRVDYAGIIEARRVEFGAAEIRGRRAVVRVFFVGGDGALTPCIYSMVNEGESWKIEAAHILRRIPKGSRLDGVRV